MVDENTALDPEWQEVCEAEWEHAWDEELSQRIEAREAGKSVAVPLEIVLAKVRARLGAGLPPVQGDG